MPCSSRLVAYGLAVVWGAMGLLVGTGLVIATGRPLLCLSLALARDLRGQDGAGCSLSHPDVLHDLVVGPRVRRTLGNGREDEGGRATAGALFGLVASTPLLMALFVLLLAVR